MEGSLRSRNLRVLCAPLVVLMLAIVGCSARATERQALNFNPGWKVLAGDPAGAEKPTFDDAKWKSVTLPHAFNEDDAFKKDIRELSTGIAWYRKSFELAKETEGKKIFIEFQGVRLAAEVFVNGKPIALHENGVMAFGIDLTPYLNPGRNTIAVRTNNAWDYKERATGSPMQWNDRNFYPNYGGINKNVVLHVTDPLHQTLPLYSNLGTSGVYVYATDHDISGRSAKIHAESEVKNDRAQPARVSYAVRVEDMQGKTVATFDGETATIAPKQTATLRASAKLSNLHFWSWGYGYLYNVYTTLKVDGAAVDTVKTRTGFRKTEFANGAVKLNDRTIHLKGYAQRTTNEWPAVGINLPPWVSDFSNGMMVESNANLVRWMHVTPSKQDVESCDRVGLMQALPAGDSERDPDGRRWQLRVEVMRDAILYNRNNPSVIFYEAGNAEISAAHMDEMLALKQKHDPHGGRAMGSREMLASKTAEWGGEMLYVNKSAAKPLWATEYSRDEAARKFMDELTPPFHKDGDGPLHRNEPAPSYNRNQDSMAVETVVRWHEFWRERPGTGTRVNAGGVNIIFSDSNSHHRGALNYRTSGEVDAMRISKEGFFAHKVIWDGWMETERPAAHIIGHWNYAAGTKKKVTVISTANRVELSLNGKSLGSGKQSHRFLFTFENVEWQPGSLRAVGYDGANRQICETEIHTVGAPAAIRLTPRTGTGGWKADASDLALVDVEIIDAKSQRCPTAMNEITFNLSGNAEWRGGIAQGPDNHVLSKKLPVELGINRVILRSTTTPGEIRLSASTPGLPPVSIALKTIAADNSALARIFPDAGLPSRLDRGATPSGDSIKITRKAHRIVKILAGSAEDQAINTIDDNEETTWANDGKLQTAWISFDLEKAGEVNELTLKLGSWRSRSYPIRVLVDDKEVFVGGTPRSLGYVTIPLKPTVGRTVTIKLIAEARDRDDFDIVEITGQKQAAGTGGNEQNRKGTLRIVEAEVYGPVSR